MPHTWMHPINFYDKRSPHASRGSSFCVVVCCSVVKCCSVWIQMVCCRVGRHGQAAAIMRSNFSCVKEPRTDMALFAKESPLKRRDRHIRAEAVFILEPASLRVSPPPSVHHLTLPLCPSKRDVTSVVCMYVAVCCSVLQCVAIC